MRQILKKTLIILALATPMWLSAQFYDPSDPSRPIIQDFTAIYEFDKANQSRQEPEPGKNQMLMRQLGELDWERTLTSLSLRVSLRILTTNLMKKHVHEWRPDGSGDNSMPSRHAVWAYGIAGALTYATAPVTPWVAIVTQTGANAVGMQRVMARRHWPGDVFAGAAIGIGLDMVVRGMTNAVFGRQHELHGWNTNHNTRMSSVMAYTGVWAPISDKVIGDYEVGTALTSSLRCNLGGDHILGVAIDALVMSAPIKSDGIALQPLSSVTLSAGPTVHASIGQGPLALRAEARCGYRAYMGAHETERSKGALAAAVSAGFDVSLTDKLQIGAEAGYDVSKLSLDTHRTTLQGFTAGIFTRANF